MKFTEKDLLMAQKDGVISTEVFEKLVEYLGNNRAGVKRKFTIENFMYYFGGLLIIIAMAWFMCNMDESFGHLGLFITSLIYFGVFLFAGETLWKADKKTPGGILFTCAVSIVPLIVWALEATCGIMDNDKYPEFHHYVRGGWILMEIATIVVGTLILQVRKFPLLTLPICYAMWYLSMDLVPILMGQMQEPTWNVRRFVSLIFSIVMVACAYSFDRTDKKDFSHWLYIFGATMMWGAMATLLSTLGSHNFIGEFGEFLLALFSFGFMILSIILKRKVFMVWGAIGIIDYIGHLGCNLFKDSPLFPAFLAAFGLMIIYLGVYYAKNFDKIEAKLTKLIMGKNAD